MRRDELPNSAGEVVVLSGGLSHEREVSLHSGRRVARALRESGHEVVEVDLDGKLISTLAELTDPVVFPLLHGETGEDGSLREVLDLLGVTYVGSPAAACRMAFDKAIATPRIAEAGLATPQQVALPHEIFREMGASSLMAALTQQLGFPMMIKPSRSGSALGVTQVQRAEDLPAAMVAAYAYGSVAVAERFVTGTEVTVAVVETSSGPLALPAVEIRPDSGVYDYAARYTPGATRFLCPAELDAAVAAAAAELALRVHSVLGLRDLSRTDVIIESSGRPVFLETSVAPGMTRTSAVPLAAEAHGWTLGQLCTDLVAAARARKSQ